MRIYCHESTQGGACLTFHHYEKLDRSLPSDYSMDDDNRSPLIIVLNHYHNRTLNQFHKYCYKLFVAHGSKSRHCHKPSFHMSWLILASWKVPTPNRVHFPFPRLRNFLYFGDRSVLLLRNPYRSKILSLKFKMFIIILMCFYWFSEISVLMREIIIRTSTVQISY